MATRNPDGTTEEEEYGIRVQLLRGLLENTLKDKFHNHLPTDPHQLWLEFQQLKPQIDILLKKKRIKKEQYTLIIPPYGSKVYSEKFDSSLYLLLLFEFCGYILPSYNWKPKQRDRSDVANFVRARKGRNIIQHSKLSMPKQDYLDIFDSLEQPLRELGANAKEVEKLKYIPIIDMKTKARMNNLEQSNLSLHYNYMSPVKNFFGREEELKIIHEALVDSFEQDIMSKPAVGVILSAMGGVGKTQTTREYWRRYATTYYDNTIMWINAESHTTIENAFLEIGEQGGLKTKTIEGKNRPIKEIISRVYSHFAIRKSLSSPRKVLFVFDNVKDQKQISGYLPESKNSAPHILITTQSTEWDTHFHLIPLKAFSEETALEFLKQNLPDSQRKEHCCLYLVSLLGGHPLAIQQALSYIIKNSMTVHHYITLFNERKKELLSEGTKELHNPSVFATLTLALENLEEMGDVDTALLLLNVMAHLNGNDIQKGLLLKFCNDDVFVLNKSLNLLQTYSFIDIAVCDEPRCFHLQTVTIHALHQYMLDLKQRQNGTFKPVLDKITDVFFDDLKDSAVKNGKYWFKHFLYMYRSLNTKTEVMKRVQKDLLEDLSHLFASHNALPKLKIILQSMYIERENFQTTEDASLMIQCYVAECIQEDGRCNEAIQILYNVLSKQQELFDLHHKDVLKTKENIAFCLLETEKYDEAMEILQQIEKVQLQSHGESHPSYLKTKSNIARCLMDSENYHEAMDLLEQVEKTQLETLGESQPLYFTTKNRIACCLLNMEKYDEALEVFRQVEKIELQTLGQTHPTFVTTRNNIARCLLEAGRYNEAMEVFQQVEKFRLKSLGEAHPSYLTTKHNIAFCFLRTGNYGDALEMFQEVEKVNLQIFGETHPSYLITKSNISQCLVRTGRYNEAIETLEQVGKIQLITLGETHPSYLTTKDRIAFVTLKRDDGPIKQCECCSTTIKVNCKETPISTLLTKADCLCKSEKYDEAIKLLEQVEKVQLQALGESHPVYLNIKSNISHCLMETRKYNEAIEILEQVGKIQKETLGETHPSYLTTKNRITFVTQKRDSSIDQFETK